VADFYAASFSLHPELRLIAVTDLDHARAACFGKAHGALVYQSVEALLADPTVEIVVNLTNPDSHFVVSRAALLAGKHVYSEKPLAMEMREAKALVELAEEKGVLLSVAPCGFLGESLQALRTALRRNDIGQVRLIYAEIDDGPIHQMQPDEWRSPAGTPWPWRDEFSVGCTIEHAAYHLTWMVALFGPARSVTGFSARLVADKHLAMPPDECAPDFSVGCIQFESGVVARLTCSIVAPHDHWLRIIGDEGVLSIDEIWHFGAPLRIRRFDALTLRADSYAWLGRHSITRRLFNLHGRKSPLSPKSGLRRSIRRHEMDYALGITDLADAIQGKRPPALPAALALHVNEIVLAIQQAGESGGSVQLTTTFASQDV
jgi:predicted dehydrogenase